MVETTTVVGVPLELLNANVDPGITVVWWTWGWAAAGAMVVVDVEGDGILTWTWKPYNKIHVQNFNILSWLDKSE